MSMIDLSGGSYKNALFLPSLNDGILTYNVKTFFFKYFRFYIFRLKRKVYS